MHLAPRLRLGLVVRICHLGFCSEKKRSCNLPPKLVPPCLQSVSPARVCPTLPPKRVSSTCLYNPPRTQTEGPRRVRGPSPRARGSAPRTRGPCGPAPRIHGPASRASWPAPRARGPARARGTPRAGPAGPLRGRAGFAGRNIMFYMRCKTFLMTTSSLPPMWSSIFSPCDVLRSDAWPRDHTQ